MWIVLDHLTASCFIRALFYFSLYGVLDGFAGTAVADFAVKKLPAELLFGQVGCLSIYL